MSDRAIGTVRAAAAVLVGLAALAGTAGCSGGGDPEPRAPAATVAPGPSAGSPACTRLIRRLPPSLLGFERGSAPADGAAGWGALVLRCGVAEPGPTSTGCIGVNGVDWVFTEDATRYTFVTYGRSPAVELTVPTSVPRTRAPGAMAGLAEAVAPIPQSKEHTCL